MVLFIQAQISAFSNGYSTLAKSCRRQHSTFVFECPGRKDGAASPSPVLGVAFEANLDSHVTLSDAEIGERRLNNAETLKLVRVCPQSIIARCVFV
jgi:hypothetical protein